MRQRVLLVAAATELRARFGRKLQSTGYAVELASDEKRRSKTSARRQLSGSNFSTRGRASASLGVDARGFCAIPCRK